MQRNGLLALLVSIICASIGAAIVMNLTFPDSIAVYDPFKRKIKLRNLDWTDSLTMFVTSSLLVLALVINSLIFTVQNSSVMRKIIESTKICFSLTLLTAERYACLACILPLVVFFVVLYLNYSHGNIYGVAVEYLGVITYFQLIQFFQNFKNLFFFFKSLIMARRIEDEAAIKNFDQITVTCRMFGKLSNGVALFILIVLCFVILVDSFNIQIVDTIIVIEPFYILGMCAGVLIFFMLTSLDIAADSHFSTKFLLNVKTHCLKRIDDPDFEPPITDIAKSLVTFGFQYQLFSYTLPTLLVLGFVFALFGKKMVSIVLFGAFMYVILTCYHTLIKAELLSDVQGALGDQPASLKTRGVDPVYIAMLSNFVGANYRKYTAEPYAKLLLLFCSALMCSEYFISSTGLLAQIHGILANSSV